MEIEGEGGEGRDDSRSFYFSHCSRKLFARLIWLRSTTFLWLIAIVADILESLTRGLCHALFILWHLNYFPWYDSSQPFWSYAHANLPARNKEKNLLVFNRKGKCKTTLTSLANFNCMSSWENSILRSDFKLFHAYNGGSWDESLGTSP